MLKRYDGKEASTMTIEIHRPELEALIIQRMKRGGFHNVEDVLMQALEAPPLPAKASSQEKPDNRTGADLIAALQASPYRELDIEPPRHREPLQVRDVVL
jgi:hypothetical protein